MSMPLRPRTDRLGPQLQRCNRARNLSHEGGRWWARVGGLFDAIGCARNHQGKYLVAHATKFCTFAEPDQYRGGSPGGGFGAVDPSDTTLPDFEVYRPGMIYS